MLANAILSCKWRRALASAWALPDGYSRVRYRNRLYGMSVRRFNGGRSLKLFAEALDGGDHVSANLYRSRASERLLPCEMSAERVIEFLCAFEPAENRRRTGPSAR